MKKLFLVIILILSFCSPSFADKTATTKILTVNGAVIVNYPISDGVTVASDGILQSGNVGYSAMLVKVSGNISIACEVSTDGSNWYTPNTTDGSSLTAAGAVVTGITSDSWIVLVSKLAPFIRYKFTSSGSSTITANLIWQNEN